MISHFKKVLVLAPHTDDGEFGCGGTIAKLIKNNVSVHYVAFSACKQSVLPQFPADILITEVKEATAILGIPPQNLILKDYDVRTFNYHRQAILEDMIQLRATIQPDLVLMPALHDIHQDHQTIAEEGLRAFKHTSILAYEIIWNNLNFNSTCFVTLSPEDIALKTKALNAYKSQAHRPYANETFINALAHTRGVQIGSQYAETFEVLRWVM